MLLLVAESPGHAAATGVTLLDLETRRQPQGRQRRRCAHKRPGVAVAVEQHLSWAAIGCVLEAEVQSSLPVEHIKELLQEQGLLCDHLGLVVVQEVGVLVPQGQEAAWLASHDVCALLDVGVQQVDVVPGVVVGRVQHPLGYHRTPAALSLHDFHLEACRLQNLRCGHADGGVVEIHKGVVEQHH